MIGNNLDFIIRILNDIGQRGFYAVNYIPLLAIFIFNMFRLKYKKIGKEMYVVTDGVCVINVYLLLIVMLMFMYLTFYDETKIHNRYYMMIVLLMVVLIFSFYIIRGVMLKVKVYSTKRFIYRNMLGQTKEYEFSDIEYIKRYYNIRINKLDIYLKSGRKISLDSSFYNYETFFKDIKRNNIEVQVMKKED